MSTTSARSIPSPRVLVSRIQTLTTSQAIGAGHRQGPNDGSRSSRTAFNPGACRVHWWDIGMMVTISALVAMRALAGVCLRSIATANTTKTLEEFSSCVYLTLILVLLELRYSGTAMKRSRPSGTETQGDVSGCWIDKLWTIGVFAFCV
eukprot:TRINITY_DN8608_c1_g1_i1.p1 TRINITY_DN8608_c1_g1~~TRINITY_DN8608_c1_g1_i1.p1  ORF type:complete len:149 (+),score=12.12 TRINITY_DN8608_c1_g1_i1:94-540(+)